MEVVVGVSAERAAQALAQCRWNVEAAIELLVDIEAKFSTQPTSRQSETGSTSDVVTNDTRADSSASAHGVDNAPDGEQTRDSAADIDEALFSVTKPVKQDDDNESQTSAKEIEEREPEPVEVVELPALADGPVGSVCVGLRTDALAQKFGPEESVHGAFCECECECKVWRVGRCCCTVPLWQRAVSTCRFLLW